MTKDQALQLIKDHIQNQNLRRHCYAVGVTMKALAEKLNADPNEWEIMGLIHDADWEETKDDITLHTKKTLEWVGELNAKDVHIRGLKSHNNKHTNLKELETQMEWALECCDELTGFVVACTLILPSKKIADLSVESIQKKFGQKSFAAAVDRTQIALCEQKLGIALPEFIHITLTAMQGISSEIGL